MQSDNSEVFNRQLAQSNERRIPDILRVQMQAAVDMGLSEH